jgi:hypothetical protein
MLTIQTIRAGMTISYFTDAPDKPLFGVVQYVGLSATAHGMLWIRVLDNLGNPALTQVYVNHVLRVLINRGSTL